MNSIHRSYPLLLAAAFGLTASALEAAALSQATSRGASRT
jgi:hypothetical protein